MLDARPLSVRELQVLFMIESGLTTSEMAAELRLSTNTIKFHRKQLYTKLGARRRSQVVAIGRKLEVLPVRTSVVDGRV